MGQACGMLKGNPVVEETIELSSQQLKMSNLPENMAKVFQGQLSDPEIRETFGDLQYALQFFMQKTRGSAPDAYSAEDIRSFFGKYFLEKPMTLELARLLMRLKKGVVGGSDQLLTKTEITRLIGLIGILKEEVVLLSPSIKILTFQPDTVADWKKVNAAAIQLRSSLQKLLRATDLPQSNFTLQDFRSVFLGLSDTVTSPSSVSTYQKIAAYGPLLESVKLLLFGPTAGFSGVTGYAQLLDGFVDFYEVVLKSYHVFARPALESPEDTGQIQQFFAKIKNLLANSAPMQTGGQIPFATLDTFVDQGFALGVVPEGLTAPTVKKFYRRIVGKILDPARPNDLASLTAFKAVHLGAVQREFDIWLLSQAFLDQIAFPVPGASPGQLASTFDAYNVTPLVNFLSTTDSATLLASWADFGLLLKVPKTLVFDSAGRLIIVPGAASPNSQWKAMMRFNLIKTLSRWLVIGYGDRGPQQIGSSLMLQADLSRWYADFNDIGLELKAFDPRRTNPGQSSFLEANFFTFNGNGDDKMSFIESFEFVGFLLGAGLNSGKQIYTDLQSAGCELNELDVLGQKKFDARCFQDSIRRNFAQEFSNLPKLVSEVQSMTPSAWDVYFQSALTATRTSNPAYGRVEQADLTAMVVVFHYIESLLKSYDADGSQTLSLQDIYDSYPRFASFLRQTNPGETDDNLKDGFAFLLFYGYKPSTIDMIGFKASKLFWNFQARRADIVKVFLVLKTDMAGN